MKSLTTLALLFISTFVFATFQGDSLNYLTPQDSVFLTVDENNQKIIEHRLEYKQTMYSLAKFYGLELNELMYFNEELGELPDIHEPLREEQVQDDDDFSEGVVVKDHERED